MNIVAKWLNEETQAIPRKEIAELLHNNELAKELLKRASDYMQESMDGDYNCSLSIEIDDFLDSL